MGSARKSLFDRWIFAFVALRRGGEPEIRNVTKAANRSRWCSHMLPSAP
jgi:hypothetical protein